MRFPETAVRGVHPDSAVEMSTSLVPSVLRASAQRLERLELTLIALVGGLTSPHAKAPRTSEISLAMQPRTHVETRYVPSSEPALPALAVQTTRLVDTYMLWVGTTDLEQEAVGNAPLQGCLSKDWACAMPARESVSMPSSGVARVLDGTRVWSRPRYRRRLGSGCVCRTCIEKTERFCCTHTSTPGCS